MNNKKKRVAMSWLSYLTRDNELTRQNVNLMSFSTFSTLVARSNDIIDPIIVDNAERDNDGCRTIRSTARSDFIIPMFRACNAFCDVAAHFAAHHVAMLHDLPYMAYTYDDFFFYDDAFLADACDFMDEHTNVQCIRIARYDVKNIEMYDANVTPKNINPEAVRHNNCPHGKPVVHVGPFKFGTRDFYESNWNPISRPSLWRTSSFTKMLSQLHAVNVLQQFEAQMYEHALHDETWVSGFMDLGACSTIPQQQSCRIEAGLGITKSTPTFDIDDAYRALNDPQNWV